MINTFFSFIFAKSLVAHLIGAIFAIKELFPRNWPVRNLIRIKKWDEFWALIDWVIREAKIGWDKLFAKSKYTECLQPDGATANFYFRFKLVESGWHFTRNIYENSLGSHTQTEKQFFFTWKKSENVRAADVIYNMICIVICSTVWHFTHNNIKKVVFCLMRLMENSIDFLNLVKTQFWCAIECSQPFIALLQNVCYFELASLRQFNSRCSYHRL